MNELPFLVVHGAVVWKVLLVVLVALSCTGVWLVRRHRARKSARAIAADFVARGTTLAVDGYVCVRGKLRGGALHSLAGTEQRHHASGTPELECDDGTRIAITRPARVAVGARERSSHVLVPRGTPGPLATKRGAWILRTLAEGDECMLEASIARSATGDTSYREDATVWQLVDSDREVLASAVTPVAVARPIHVALVALGCFLMTAFWYGFLDGVGNRALEKVKARPALGDRDSIPALGALAIAAAMPGSRSKALDAEYLWFFERYGNRASRFATYDELGALIDPCNTSDQMSQTRFDDALRRAIGCGDRDDQAWIHVFRGDYAAAFALAPKRADVREYAAVGVGDWGQAALAADATVAPPAPDNRYPEYVLRANHVAQCRAGWYRHLAGQPSGLERLDTRTTTCRVYLALTLPPERQVEALRAIRLAESKLAYDQQDRGVDEAARFALEAAGALDPDERYAESEYEVTAWDWLSPWASPSPPVWRLSFNTVGASRAALAVMRGDFATARKEATALATTDDNSVLQWVALREGVAAPTTAGREHPALATSLAARRGTLREPNLAGVFPDTCEPKLQEAAKAATGGAGGPLARVMADCHIFYSGFVRHLYGILPRVKTDRAALADALRAYRDTLTAYSLDHLPFRTLDKLAEARDFARFLDDTEEAQRLQSIIDRHAAALADRTRTLAFALLAVR